MNKKISTEFQNHNVNGNLLDIDVVAERLHISPHTVRGLVWKRKINFIKIGARVLFRAQDVEDFIQANLVQSFKCEKGKS
jgi:excisionase family DNA binding protein